MYSLLAMNELITFLAAIIGVGGIAYAYLKHRNTRLHADLLIERDNSQADEARDRVERTKEELQGAERDFKEKLERYRRNKPPSDDDSKS